VSGRLDELLNRDARRTDIVLAGASEELERALAAGHGVRRAAERLVVSAEGDEAVRAVLERALAARASVLEVTPRTETLEDLFVREAIRTRDG
jgi:ABC-2 type transport system ATP-binding protein